MASLSDIDLARQHIAGAEQRIADQLARIQRLVQEHQPTAMAEDLLMIWRESLVAFRAQLAILEAGEQRTLYRSR